MAELDDRKAELIAEINRARSRATAHRRALAEDLQVGERVKENIANNRVGWLGGAILTGLLISKVPPRTKKVVVDRRSAAIPDKQLARVGKGGFLLAIIKLLVDITKPIIMAWATKRLGQAVAVGHEVKRKVERVDRKT
jgi:hypothetical protein